MMLVSLGGCFWGYEGRDRDGGYDRGGGHDDRGEGHDDDGAESTENGIRNESHVENGKTSRSAQLPRRRAL